MSSVRVAIVGAGPGGLLLALLLSKLGVPVTVIEKSAAADPWSSKSYSINLNGRGLTALDDAGVLEEAKAAGMARHQIILESNDGQRKSIPVNPPHHAFTRPDLVECLEGILKKEHAERATIQRGVAVTKVEEKEEGMEVSLDNGSRITCTHVVGADGKWSAVRNSVADWNGVFAVQSAPAFGISITPVCTPERWEVAATSIFRPKSPKYYIIAAPLKSGRFSVSTVCFDEVKEEHPWLIPRDDDNDVDWEAEYGASTETSSASAEFEAKISKMLEEELPMFYKDIKGAESLKTVRVNRRTSWLKPLVDDPSYCSKNGRVALVGDAAHAMTPAIGEGCNCALESAVLLVKPLQKKKPVTSEDLTNAFLEFGRTRPGEVVPLQIQSAERNRYKNPVAPPAR